MVKELTPQPVTGAGQSNTPETPTNRGEFLFVTAQQLAAQLQVSISTIRNWRESGALPYVVTPGRSIRFHMPTVEQALLRRQRGGVSV
jgi:excisionase family DNA binding protein